MTLAKEFIANQKEKLLSENKLLEAELNNISTKDTKPEGDFDANFPDYGRSPEDNATEEEEYSSRVGVENSLEVKLRDVNEALKNIEENKYGVCGKCGKELEQDRLEAMPSATRCVECKK
jgi:RNA polymerase-binding protein DksA